MSLPSSQPRCPRCTPLFAACGLLVWAALRLVLTGEHLPQGTGAVYGGVGIEAGHAGNELTDELAPIPIEPVNSVGWASLEPPIIITNGDHRYNKVIPGRRTRWHYLDALDRKQIRSTLKASRVVWRRLVLHASGSDGANAALLEDHQRQLRPSMGPLAYHFVIGNGSYSGAGAIEIGPRWHNQLLGTALSVPKLNEGTISVCLVGQFDETPVPAAQVAALEELTAYLRARLGEIRVITHDSQESEVETCPGRFVNDALLKALNGK